MLNIVVIWIRHVNIGKTVSQEYSMYQYHMCVVF